MTFTFSRLIPIIGADVITVRHREHQHACRPGECTQSIRQTNLPTRDWQTGRAVKAVSTFVRSSVIDGVALCSVVPKVTPLVTKAASEGIRCSDPGTHF